MKPSRLRLASLAFVIPLCATLFSVWWMLRDDGDRARMKAAAKLNELLSTMVEKADEAQSDWVARLEASADSLVVDLSAENLRNAPEKESFVRTAALLDGKGTLVFPESGRSSLREKEFLDRSADLLNEPWMPPREENGTYPAEGLWQRFFWRDGIQLLYWKALSDGSGFLLLEIERSALLADLAWRVGAPPFPNGLREGHSIVLADEMGQPFLLWPDRADTNPPASAGLHEKVRSSIALSGALQGWQFTWTADLGAVPGIGDFRLILGLLLGLAVAASSVLSLSLLRRIGREVREAGERVSFVNQVSHELKTPLTNIRLYAEMLESKLSASGKKTKEAHYTGIILRESARLSRLIHNVLTFARLSRTGDNAQNGLISLHARPTVPDKLVAEVVEGFSASLAEKNMEVSLSLGAPAALNIDPDICEQLLGNLISNAEKYARLGAYVGVRTLMTNDPLPVLKIEVCDRGEGLPSRNPGRAFQPFFRFHEKHTDGVGGAGLGLAIVRELAVLHGGDAGYKAQPGGGACFWFTLLPVPTSDTEEKPV